jgi:PAS domain S-box-containing protein
MTPVRQGILHAAATLYCVLICGAPRVNAGQQPILVGTEFDYPPYSYTDDRDSITGFNVELIRALGRVMGREIIVSAGPWADIRHAFERGELHAIVGMFFSAQRDSIADFTPPFTYISHTAFVNARTPAVRSRAGLRGKRLIVMDGDIMHDYVKQRRLTETVLTAATYQQALRMLARGDGDAALAARLPGIYWKKKLDLQSVRKTGIVIQRDPYCLAVAEGDIELLSELTEGLMILRESGELKEIRNHWLGVMQRPVSSRTLMLVLCGVAGVIGLGAAGAWLWFRLLRKEVRRRTAQLQREAYHRTRAEKRAREREERYRRLFEQSNDAIFIHGEGGGILDVNQRACEIIGAEKSAIVGEQLSGLHPPEDASIGLEACERVLREGSSRFEIRFRRADGTLLDAEVSAKLIDADQGVIQGIVRDITERKRAETILRESEERFRIYIEHSPTAVFLSDSAGRYIFANQAAQDLTGFSREQLLAMSIPELAHPDSLGQARRDFPELMRTGLLKTEISLRTAGRGRVDVLLQAVRITNDQYLAFCTDITARKKIEDDMRRAKEAAEAANRAKSEFLANMSHEIRTPMNGIIGMTDLALETTLSATQRDYLNAVKNSASTLLDIINEVLDFSKIESGAIALERRPFNLRAAAAEACSVMAVRAHEKGLELLCDIPPDIPSALIGDSLRVRQIMINLLGNAIKFTDTGEAALRVASLGAGENADEIRLEISVSDSGIGIRPERLETIFQSFDQGGVDTLRSRGGTGLGLTISRRLARLLGGELTVESEFGKGSVFRFVAPFTVHAGHTEVPHPRRLPEQVRVCVVDDNAGNRRIVGEMLRAWGIEHQALTDGASALAAIEEAHARNRPFSAILLDCRMPGMDGVSVARALRERYGGEPIIIMLSSTDSPDVMHQLRELEVVHTLVKPVFMKDLARALERMLSLGPLSSGEAGRRIEAPAQLRGLALVAEDNPVNRKIVTVMLARRGVTFVEAENGRLALERARERAFDLILMDVQMPEMDGYEAARRLRDEGNETPIVAMTAYAMQSDRQRAIAAGMNDFCTKPINRDEFDRIMRTYLPAARSEQPAGFDKAALIDRFGEDPALWRELFELFRDTATKSLHQLREHLDTKNAEGLGRAAHSLKGAAGTLALNAVVALARSIEAAAESRDFSAVETMTDRLDVEIETSIQAGLAEVNGSS